MTTHIDPSTFSFLNSLNGNSHTHVDIESGGEEENIFVVVVEKRSSQLVFDYNKAWICACGHEKNAEEGSAWKTRITYTPWHENTCV